MKSRASFERNYPKKKKEGIIWNQKLSLNERKFQMNWHFVTNSFSPFLGKECKERIMTPCQKENGAREKNATSEDEITYPITSYVVHKI